MFVLADSNPVRRIRAGYVNRGLIALCIGVFLLELAEAIPFDAYALVPAQLFGPAPMPPEFGATPAAVRLVTHIFLHAGWLHLLGNMVVLWVFGDNVEDATGHARYLVFFLLCGVAGGLAEAAMTEQPEMPMVGASGAISGVMGAYLLLHPRAKVLVLLLFRIPVLVPASVVVALSIGTDVIMAAGHGLATEPDADTVAWWAHVGGFAAGIGLLPLLRHADVPLFQPASTYPEVPFPRLRRVLIDLSPRTAPDAGTGARLAAVFKMLLFLVLLTVLASLF